MKRQFLRSTDPQQTDDSAAFYATIDALHILRAMRWEIANDDRLTFAAKIINCQPLVHAIDHLVASEYDAATKGGR